MTPALHIPLIVELHAEDAAILWLQRDRAVDAPHYNRKFLARLDERLEANLEGLRVAGRAGWEAARAAFDTAPEPGEAFTLAVLAFDVGSARGIGEVLDIVGGDQDGSLTRAAISGLGWLDATRLRGLVQPLLDDHRPHVRALGLGACSVHRVDPGEQLSRFLNDDPVVRSRALLLAGQLGRADLLPEIAQGEDDDPECQRRAAWAAVLLGDRRRALEHLKSIASVPGARQMQALELAVLAMEANEVKAWIQTVGQGAEEIAARAAGRMGLPELVPWLIDRMADPHLGRVAGESFSMITGLDIEFLDLDGPAPDGVPEGPNDDPAESNVELDADVELPWPNPAAVEAWWAEHGKDYATGRRHFLGQLASDDSYRRGFELGYQRQRRVASIALACRNAGTVQVTWRSREYASRSGQTNLA